MKNLAKTIYFCPVEGVVSQNDTHTHEISIIVNGHLVDMTILNKGYLTDKPTRSTLTLTKEGIIKHFNSQVIKDDLIGKVEELVEEFPDEFIVSIVISFGKL